MSKVSVIVPVYNVEQYLKKCLQSLINQTYNDYEIICVNDGSTDSSLEILKSFQVHNPEKIKIINQQNMGLSAARNTGVRHSNSEWYIFVDSDDWVASDFIEQLYNTAIENKVKLVKCNITFFEADSQFDLYDFCADKYSTQFLLSKFQPSVWNGIYHASLFKRVVFPEGLLYEDLAIFPLIAGQLDEFYYIDAGLYFYNRTNVNSIMNTVSPKVFQMIDSFEWLLKSAREVDILAKFHEEIEFLAVRHIFIYHLDVIKGNFSKSDIKLQLQRIADLFAEEFPGAADNQYVQDLLSREIQKWALKKLVSSKGKSIVWYWRYLKIHG